MKFKRCAVYLSRAYIDYKLSVYNWDELDAYLELGYEVERVDKLPDPEHPVLIYILKKEVDDD